VDVGTGSGILAIHMSMLGIKNITALDNHEPALFCAKKNFQNYKLENKIKLIYSDLLSNIDSNSHLGIVVFNHNFYPANNNRFGSTNEGGRDIIERFLKQIKTFNFDLLLMPYSEVSTDTHNPHLIAQNFGFTSELFLRKYAFNQQN
jgi:16S rRNA G966 N2-methylase RsmD